MLFISMVQYIKGIIISLYLINVDPKIGKCVNSFARHKPSLYIPR